MEILQFILNFLANNLGNGQLSCIFDLLKQNDFDISKTIKNFNPDSLAPILNSFMNMQKNSHKEESYSPCGLNPIAKIADKDIVYTLNKYFS